MPGLGSCDKLETSWGGLTARVDLQTLHGVSLPSERRRKMKTPKRPAGSRETENENLRLPAQPGKPPRPATEPPGSAWSTKSTETATDPATGEPIKPAEAGRPPGGRSNS